MVSGTSEKAPSTVWWHNGYPRSNVTTRSWEELFCVTTSCGYTEFLLPRPLYLRGCGIRRTKLGLGLKRFSAIVICSSCPQDSFPSGRLCLIVIPLGILGPQYFHSSSPRKISTTSTNARRQCDGWRPSLSALGDLASCVVAYSRSPPPLLKRELESKSRKNGFTVSRPQLSSIALLALQVGMRPSSFNATTLKVGVSQTHSKQPPPSHLLSSQTLLLLVANAHTTYSTLEND